MMDKSAQPPYTGKVYKSLIAGQWYDAEPIRLKQQLTELFGQAEQQPLEKNVIGLILPHAGYQYSGKTACKAIKTAQNTSFNRVIILGTSHRAPMKNLISIPSDDFYETPLGKIPVDTQAIQELKNILIFK